MDFISSDLKAIKYIVILFQAESREIVPGSVEYAIESVQPNTIAPGTFTIDRFDGELTVNRFVDFKDTDPNRPGM